MRNDTKFRRNERTANEWVGERDKNNFIMLIFRSSNSRTQDTTGTLFPVRRKPKPALKAMFSNFVIEKQVVSRFFVFASVHIMTRRVILPGISKKAEVMGVERKTNPIEIHATKSRELESGKNVESLDGDAISS